MAAASLGGLLAAGEVHEDLPHGARRRTEEVGAPIPPGLRSTPELEECFVYELGRRECRVRPCRPKLMPGDALAFPNAGAYGLGASPWLFHGHPAPAEVAFDGTRIETIRFRQEVRAVLGGQARLPTSSP